MWIVFAIGTLFGVTQGVESWQTRHLPEPPNSPWKLPGMIVLIALCIGLIFLGSSLILFSLLAALCVVQAGFVLAGRSPWWMQGRFDKAPLRYESAPPRDLDVT